MQSPEYYKENIERLLMSTRKKGIENVVEWLNKSQFYDVPASVKFHNNYAHGLMKHSFEVYEEAIRLRKEAIDYNPETVDTLPIDSVIICSLLHDVCKADVYYIDDKNRVKSRKTCYLKGHGQRSIWILRDIGLQMTELEEWAIWWHMGQYEVSRPLYQKEYEKSLSVPLCSLIHIADSNAAKEAIREDYR